MSPELLAAIRARDASKLEFGGTIGFRTPDSIKLCATDRRDLLEYVDELQEQYDCLLDAARSTSK